MIILLIIKCHYVSYSCDYQHYSYNYDCYYSYYYCTITIIVVIRAILVFIVLMSIMLIVIDTLTRVPLPFVCNVTRGQGQVFRLSTFSMVLVSLSLFSAAAVVAV